MKNTTLLLIIGIFVLTVGVFMYFSSASEQTTIVTGNAVNEGPIARQAQEFTIGESNYNYAPNEIRVKAGQPVRLTLDNSVKGCLRSFNIPDMEVSKYAKTPSDKIEFTPDKKGTFGFRCAMGMGYGTIIVE